MGGAVRARETWTAFRDTRNRSAPLALTGRALERGQQLNVLEHGAAAGGYGRAGMGDQWQTTRRACVFRIVA